GGGGGYTPSAVTSTTGSATVPPSAGGKIGLGSDAVIDIPAYALKESSSVEVKVAKVASPPATPPGARLASDVYEFTVGGKGTYNFAKNVTITLAFNSASISADETPVLHYYDESMSKWVNIGGTVSGSTISATVDHLTKFAVLAVKKEVKPETQKPVVSLKDIAGHWAEAKIKQLVASGAIGGYPDGSFKPDKQITRAEFATVLVKAFNLAPQSGKVFGDTARHWAKDYVATAAAYGIINGYNPVEFGPDDPITREQMAVMVVKAAKLDKVAGGKTFRDSSRVASWAREAVATASAKGIITGYADNTFRPQGKATRAEAVAIILNALK
ncbi:MAG: S-layer homology domain-containing protein, partial [Syntrophomonadaceae bacterium]|nr:S-layer homology domain-containing protein [Syntrophomonadaceae bacterium]